MKKSLFLLAFLMITGFTLAQPAHYITFNGTDQYMRIPHHSDFNIAADQSFTLTGWVRNETYTSAPRYVCKRDMSAQSAGNERTGYEFFGTGNAGQSLGLNTPTATTGHALSVYTGVTIPAGEWTHFALVVDRDNNEIRIHHDMNMPDDWSAPLNDWFVANTHDVFIGAGNNNGQPNNFCNGSFANIRFYGMALDHDAIVTDYYHNDLAELTPEMQAHLLAAYDFSTENITGNQLADLSGHGHDGELVNLGGTETPTRTVIYRPGDYGSANYRIPAVITAKDGSIVAVTDKRKYNEGDLPQDIDIVCNRSTDGGLTWSEPYTIALGTGYNQGFGDCALAWSNDENGLIAAFVGGVGLWNSTPTNPIRSYISRSYDNGQTWTEPVDITHFIFGADCVIPEHQSWRASFFGSGNGLRTSTGRIMFVAAIREGSAQSLNNYAVYSDDNGQTWQVSGRASVGGDEAKVTELVDGRILMSIRHAGNRWYNISEDGGETWQSTTSTWDDIVAPACNGDLIRYTSVNNGDDRNRLLHSVPYGNSRTDVSVYISYDEGETWPVRKCIVPYSSAYSSLCILPDGTIGLYVEEAPDSGSGYSTVFYNFSLEWLTDGNDHYMAVAENPKKEDSLKIYPSPTSTFINIETEGVKVLNIYNSAGQLVKTIKTNGAPEVRVDVSSMAAGLYLIEALDLNGIKKAGRFVK